MFPGAACSSRVAALYSDREDTEFWFNIYGTLVRYSIEEFCLIMGLKCDVDDDTSKFLMKKGGLKDVTLACYPCLRSY